jgi:hypothetical protein
MARHAGARTVFVPQTWQVRETPQGGLTEPTEEYLVLRTIADLLGGAEPGPRIEVAPGVYCLAFRRENSTVLAMWDARAPRNGRDLPIQLGRAERQVDLWGQVRSLQRDEQGRQIVRLSPMPIFVDAVEPWLVAFRTSLGLSPARIETGVELAEHALEIAYEGSKAVSAVIRVVAPEGWDVTPRVMAVNLMPRQPQAFPLQVRYPHNAPAGFENLLAQITLPEESYYLEVPLPVQRDLSDADVWGMASIQHGVLVLTHTVTNQSNETLHFRGAANVPGRERQYRPILNLRPGETQSVRYRFPNASDLASSTVRLALREMNDGPRSHTIELEVP